MQLAVHSGLVYLCEGNGPVCPWTPLVPSEQIISPYNYEYCVSLPSTTACPLSRLAEPYSIRTIRYFSYFYDVGSLIYTR